MSGATCSPYLPQEVLMTHLKNHKSALVKGLARFFYVDNFSPTFNKPEEMVLDKNAIQNILLKANMPLRRWFSNDPVFNKEDRVQNILWIQWDAQRDTLSLASIYVPSIEFTLTKRSLLSGISSFFGPLDLFSY